ncbi:MAG: MFS transporter [Bacteroidaceae bacterium]|nr:MFS transporter [Bacteroidaceae bacterium]
MNENTNQEAKGFYKLSWIQRIGFGSGDLAQNLIFQVTCMYLLFFYTDIYGLDKVDVSVMFLVGNVANVLWDPIVGALIDKSNPRLGKYRSYLVYVGIPLSGFAILCFYDGFAPSLLYAYVTYIAMTLLYTFINVPYGALNSSLTRDTDEITILTSVRMFMANCGGLAVGSGLPLLITFFADGEQGGLPKDSKAWFITMSIYGVVGLLLLFFCFSQCKERVVMDAKDSEDVKVSDLWKEFGRNKPLRVIAFFFITAFAMMSIGNAAGAYFVNSNLRGTPEQLSVFMGLGSIPAFIFMPLVPAIKKAVGKKNMFYIFLSVAIVGMVILYIVAKMENPNMMLIYIAQFIKSTGVIVATGYMWALVPEVISYGEYVSGRRIAGIVNALTGIFFKAGMTIGSVVAPAILAYVAYDENSIEQTPFAQEGILWLVCVIPAFLLILAIWIISKYELSDSVIDKINKEIESRNM